MPKADQVDAIISYPWGHHNIYYTVNGVSQVKTIYGSMKDLWEFLR